MKEIFQKMMSKEFSEDMLLSKAYGIIKGVHKSWVVCDDCTIKEQCHRICDQLELEGTLLANVPVDTIGERFEKIKFAIDYPPEYLKLLDSLEYVKTQKNKLIKFPNANTKSLEIISSHIEIIKKQIKEFNDQC